MNKKILYMILLTIIGSIGSRESVEAVTCGGKKKLECNLSLLSCFWNEKEFYCYPKKKCNELTMKGECTGTMYEPLKCAWLGTGTGGKCLLKSSIKKCSDLTLPEECSNIEYKSLNCAWHEDTCKPMSEVPCEKKNEAYCGKEKTSCFFYEPKQICYTKKKSITECKNLMTSPDCEDWQFSYLNCGWTGKKCQLKSSIKCADLGTEQCTGGTFQSLKCGWTGTQCLLKSSIKCDDLGTEQCTGVTFQSLKCAWLGTKERGNCLLKSSIKCGDLGTEEDCTGAAYKSLKCAWVEKNKSCQLESALKCEDLLKDDCEINNKCRWENDPVIQFRGKCVKRGFS
jgi:hypothetical protein